MTEKPKRKTWAEYKKSERDKRKSKGLIRKEYWIKPEWHKLILAFIKKLDGGK